MLLDKMRRLLSRQAGATLVELTVATGLITAGAGLLAGGVYELLAVDRFWRDDVVATKELRNAESWFAGDALGAEYTTLTDGAPPVHTVTLWWTDSAGVPHSAMYHVVDGELVRIFDGVQTSLARHVVSASFWLTGRVLHSTLVVKADRGGTRSSSLQTYLRVLK